ncbi:energy transducer TonB [Commensalibacter intestini]|uniref:energy transducer TonB n=1 Tax=Commensalibacter intestini TaxID=479936 RepID=UPI000681B0CA|nr:energy transducer TonB [Commensalibacter intestini]
MTNTDRPLNQKKLSASSRDHSVGSVVPNESIHHTPISSQRPEFVKKTKATAIKLAGFPLLRKEAYSESSALTKIQKEPPPLAPSLPTLHAKHSLLHYRNEPEQKSLVFYLAGSLIAHGLICLGIYLGTMVFPAPPMDGNSSQGQPVDVVFAPSPTGSSGLTGDGVTAEDGQSSPPPQPAAVPEVTPPPTPEQDVSAPEPQTEELPQDTDGIPIPIPQQQKQATRDHQYTYRYTPPRRQQQHRQQPTPEQSNNPFANMQTLDFSENPNKSRRRAARNRLPQGSRSSIDMSTGPLVKNGKINVPYAAKINIKGVSDDYAEAISTWVYKHMYYPIEAAQRGEDGSPSVKVSLNRNGYVLSVTLTNSSGSDALDAAITGMFRNARLPNIPPDLPDHFELNLTINYLLLRR